MREVHSLSAADSRSFQGKRAGMLLVSRSTRSHERANMMRDARPAFWAALTPAAEAERGWEFYCAEPRIFFFSVDPGLDFQ